MEQWMNHEISGEEQDITVINDILRKMKIYSVLRNSQLVRRTMALKYIKWNYYRVSDILRRMNAILEYEYTTKEDISRGLKDLVR